LLRLLEISSNRVPVYLRDPCTTSRAGVGSVGRLAGAASSTRLVTR